MKILKCECCGAALPIPARYARYIKCEYCNATYKLKEENEEESPFFSPLKYVLMEPGYIKKYSAGVSVNEDKLHYYPKEVIEKFVREELTHKLVEALMKDIKLYEDYDVRNFERRYIATINVDTRKY